MIPNCRPREGRRDLSFGSALAPLSRPGPLLVAYRWRYELGIVCVLLAGTAAAWQAGPGPALAGLAVAAAVTALAATRPAFRSFAAARAWCVITPHRVRTCFAQAWVHNRAGQIPAVLRTAAQPFGERVLLWCRAGTSFEDIESVLGLLAAACWAVDVIASRRGNHAHLVYLDVIRRPQWEARPDAGPGPADSDIPPWPWSDTGPDWRRLPDRPDEGGHDAA